MPSPRPLSLRFFLRRRLVLVGFALCIGCADAAPDLDAPSGTAWAVVPPAPEADIGPPDALDGADTTDAGQDAVPWDAAADTASDVDAPGLGGEPRANDPLAMSPLPLPVGASLLAGTPVASGALLVAAAPGPDGPSLFSVVLRAEDKPPGPARRIAGPPVPGQPVESAELAWDWRSGRVLLVVGTARGPHLALLDDEGRLVRPLRGFADGVGGPVAARRTAQGYRLAWRATTAAVGVSEVGPDAAPLRSPTFVAGADVRGLGLPAEGATALLTLEGATSTRLLRLDPGPREGVAWPAGTRIVADGVGLWAVDGPMPGDEADGRGPARTVTSQRVDAWGQATGPGGPLLKGEPGASLLVVARPGGGLVVRAGEHLARVDAGRHAVGPPAHVAPVGGPELLVWRRDVGWLCASPEGRAGCWRFSP